MNGVIDACSAHLTDPRTHDLLEKKKYEEQKEHKSWKKNLVILVHDPLLNSNETKTTHTVPWQFC